MPRKTVSPAVTMLQFIGSASIEVAELVLDLGRDALRTRRAKELTESRQALALQAKATQPLAPAKAATAPAPAATAKPAGKKRGPKPKAKAAAAPAATAATPKARNKPGPKPGSHRKAKGQPAEPGIVAGLDLREPIGEEYSDNVLPLPPQSPAEELEEPLPIGAEETEPVEELG